MIILQDLKRLTAHIATAALTPLMTGCDGEHSARGFSSSVEMRTAQANGYLTKERLDASMTPVPVREFPAPKLPNGLADPSEGTARSMLQLCGLAHSCALAVLAAARQDDLTAIQSGLARLMALPQENRVSGPALDDLSLARQILRHSQGGGQVALELASDALQADPRRSGAWLGYGGYLMTLGLKEDAWAAVWLSWHVAKDKSAALERIQRCFLAEENQSIKAMYGPALAWIARGTSPFKQRVQHG